MTDECVAGVRLALICVYLSVSATAAVPVETPLTLHFPRAYLALAVLKKTEGHERKQLMLMFPYSDEVQ